jgi:CDP-diacylglycerol--serine O-phosphatidyltransferase
MSARRQARRAVGLHILPILPTSMTVLAICAGLTSIKFALDGQPHIAVVLLAVAAVLDGLDGRMARILHASSRMAKEIDSLADAINFGVAPALVVYVSLLSTSPAGWIVVLLYAACIALRLARFNVLSDDGTPARLHQAHSATTPVRPPPGAARAAQHRPGRLRLDRPGRGQRGQRTQQSPDPDRRRGRGCRRADRRPAGGARRSPAAPYAPSRRTAHKLGRNPLKFDAPQLMTVPDVLPNGLMNELTSSTVGELSCRRGGHYRGKVQNLTQFYHPLDFIGE